MRNLLPAVTLAVALSFTTSTGFGYGLRDLLGCPQDRSCGCGCEADCGCEPECGCDCGCEVECGCEVSCGCEPGCGCGDTCCADGRKFAGQKYTCECNSYVPWCPCTGPECCNSCECGAPCCGEPACGCDPGCGCEPGCGCGSCCQSCPPKQHQCILKHCGFCAPYYLVVNSLAGCCSSSCGCDEEVYWSEWHNDPPRCCDPCDCYGNWVGPSAGYRAPYAHAYGPETQVGGGYYAQGKSTSAARQNVVRQQPQRQQRGNVARGTVKQNSYQW